MSENGFSVTNMSTELKIAYAAIVILASCVCYSFFGGGTSKIEKWINDHPKEIIESINNFVRTEQENAQKRQRELSKENVKKYNNRLKDEKTAVVINPKGTKTVVEFFDFNCGYCREAAKSVKAIASKNNDVKFIFRDLPIFGGPSDLAAKYAIAVSMVSPTKYLEFHEVLFESGAKTKDNIIQALKKAGISVDAVEKVLKTKDSDINARLEENKQLSELLNLQGTPAFVIGEDLIPGYIGEDVMQDLLNKIKK